MEEGYVAKPEVANNIASRWRLVTRLLGLPQEWMWGNWGVRWPIRRVTLAIKRRDAIDGEPVAVFRFLSEDWPELSFKLSPSYLQTA
jgi:hypothetical protein